VRFTREVTQTNELMVEGRGGTEMIDVFPGMALDNELAGNVVDLCPVGALLDKKFLFQQRVWFLKSTPSIDGITSSGDNITVDHNEGRVYRIRPRTNMAVNQWWITDEVRHGWEFVHREDRLAMPAIRGAEPFSRDEAAEAWLAASDRAARVLREGAAAGRLAFVASPMISCEDAYLLAREVLSLDPNAALIVGPVPVVGADKTFPNGFVVRAEKAPNARGVRRVLEALAKSAAGRTAGATVHDAAAGLGALTSAGAGTVLLSGNYPSEWITPDWAAALGTRRVVMLETLPNRMTSAAEVLLPAATWVEKAGTFENATGRLQGFDRAIEPIDFCKSEAQIALDLRASLSGGVAAPYDAAVVRAEMARIAGLESFATAHHAAPAKPYVESDMTLIEL
jgi:NADH-quinone oxidoreductase subunit G